MPKRVNRLTTPQQVEEAFVRLFNQIDGGVGQYIGSAENELLKQQAIRNAVGMLEILKVIYQKDLQLHSLSNCVGTLSRKRQNQDDPNLANIQWKSPLDPGGSVAYLH
jgi:hypothetical protein